MKYLTCLIKWVLTEEQLEFPVVYAAAKNGISKLTLDSDNETMIPLLDMILEEVPKPTGSDDNGLQLQVFTPFSR